MSTETLGIAIRTGRTVSVTAALLIAVGLLSSGCLNTAAVEPTTVVDDGSDVVGVANIPGGRMIAI